MQFDCVAVTRRGLMPGRVVGIDDEGLIQVQPPNSDRVYSFPDEAILPPEEGYQLMEERRVRKVLHEYEFEELNDCPAVVRCFDPQHPRRSNYVLALGRRGWTCTCEAFLHSGRRRCKHILAWNEMILLVENRRSDRETPADADGEPERLGAAPVLRGLEFKQAA